MLRTALKATGGLTLGGLTIGGIYAGQNEGIRRSAVFWTRAAPIYAEYRYCEFQFKDRPEEEYSAALEGLHDKHAAAVLQILLDLRGFYIKIGQIGSTRDDFLPEQYLSRVKSLQDDVPAQPVEYVKALVAEELGRPFDQLFTDISPRPLGAASIGQVHSATLKSTGERVVIKVQYPNVEEEFKWDMATIKQFCALAQPAHLPFFDEIQKQFVTEFDYRGEARNLSDVADNILPVYGHIVAMPRPLMDLCTKRVLVMDLLEGVPFIKGIKRQFEGLAAKAGTTVEALEKQQRARDLEAERKGLKRSTGLPSFAIRAAAGYLYGLDLCANGARAAFNCTFGLLLGQMQYKWTQLPLDIPLIINNIWMVHGHQLLIDGCFNGDPHPGNIMLLDNGKIGLIDYGQVKRISLTERIIIAKQCIACLHDDTEMMVAVQQQAGLRTRRNDPWVFEKLARVVWDNDRAAVTGGMNIQLFMEHLNAIDPILEQNDNYIMPARMCILLNGLSYALRYELRTCRMLQGPATQLLLREDPAFLARYA